MFPQHLVGPELGALPAVQHMLWGRVHAYKHNIASAVHACKWSLEQYILGTGRELMQDVHSSQVQVVTSHFTAVHQERLTGASLAPQYPLGDHLCHPHWNTSQQLP